MRSEYGDAPPTTLGLVHALAMHTTSHKATIVNEGSAVRGERLGTVVRDTLERQFFAQAAANAILRNA